MSLVLIVEDERMLRQSLAQGVGRMDGVEVIDAGTVDEAVSLIDRRTPDLIISDIDMPGRTGLELLGEVGRRSLKIPIVFVSAYLEAYGRQIPPNANLEVMEKPVALREIRDMVRKMLAQGGEDADAFSAPDFIQLASMGRRSVIIEASWPDGSSGQIVVHGGQVWDAVAGDLPALEAFAQVAWRPGARVRCSKLGEPPEQRRLEGTAESLLMDSARRFDEAQREGDAVDRAQRYSSQPPAPEPESDPMDAFAESLDRALSPEDSLEAARPEPGQDDSAPGGMESADSQFRRLLDEGVSALLMRDYPRAVAAFRSADQAKPGDATVRANLERLKELGFADEPHGDAT